MKQETRAAIVRDVKIMSYNLVADKYGLTKNQVAGIVWRAKNPPGKRIYYKCPSGVMSSKCGRGRRGTGPYPPLTLHNTR